MRFQCGDRIISIRQADGGSCLRFVEGVPFLLALAALYEKEESVHLELQSMQGSLSAIKEASLLIPCWLSKLSVAQPRNNTAAFCSENHAAHAGTMSRAGTKQAVRDQKEGQALRAVYGP